MHKPNARATRWCFSSIAALQARGWQIEHLDQHPRASQRGAADRGVGVICAILEALSAITEVLALGPGELVGPVTRST